MSGEISNVNRAAAKLYGVKPGKVGVRERERRMAESYRAAAAEFDEVQQALREAVEDCERLRSGLIRALSRAEDAEEEIGRLRATRSRLVAVAWYGIPLALMLGVVIGWFF